MSESQPTVRAVRPDDHDEWRELYRGYAAFYEQSDLKLETTWDWLLDPDHEVEGLVAEVDGRMVGLAHYRPFSRPLAASVGGYLDDLFVFPDARGSGAADALIARLREIAHDRGWTVVRWITADDNHRARSKYDQIATRTMWVTYEMQV